MEQVNGGDSVICWETTFPDKDTLHKMIVFSFTMTFNNAFSELTDMESDNSYDQPNFLQNKNTIKVLRAMMYIAQALYGRKCPLFFNLSYSTRANPQLQH